MAHSEHLPIFKLAYGLCLYLDQVVSSFPRYHKYALGAELRECSRRLLRLVVRANSRRDRTATLYELRETAEELKVLLRLAFDSKAFQKMTSFEHAAAQIVEIAKQNEGWLKSQAPSSGEAGTTSPSEGYGQNRRAIPNGIARSGAP